MDDQSEEPSSSVPSSAHTVESASSTNISSGFYASFRAGRNIETPTKPSFLEDSDKTLDGVLASASKKNDFPSTPTLYSVPSGTSVLSTSTFGSVKRKRPADVVSKPSFNVSDFIGASPHLPKFGTSLTKVKFDLPSLNQSKFYTGRTKFGGSSSFREESAKRIKISPVSYRGPTNLTRVSAKPYSTENKRTLTSKTAENILKTLNKICTPTPVKPAEKQPFHSEFTSFSKRLREKRKAGMSSLPPPPIAKLNQVKSAQVTNIKMSEDISINTTETKCADTETILSSAPVAVTTTEPSTVVPTESETAKALGSNHVETSASETVSAPEVETVKAPEVLLVGNSDKITMPPQMPVEILNAKPTGNGIPKQDELLPAVVSKNGLKMKRQLTRDHYTASEKVEEPVNTMPEITAIQPLVISTLPKFDLSVKPAPAPIFTPIAKLPKPVNTLKSIPGSNDDKFAFSSPKIISDKNIESPPLDAKFSFISPVSIKNPGTPIISKKSSTRLGEPLSKSNGFFPVKEIIDVKQAEVIGNEKNAVGDVPLVEKKEPPTTFSFKFPNKEEGSWECPTCMITNKPDCLKCVACTEPKPGSKGPTANTQSTFSFGKTSTTISFGKTTVSSSTFSFASTNTVSSTGFTFSKPFSTICSSGLTGKTSDVASNISSEVNVEATKTESRASPFAVPVPNSTESIISKASSEESKPNPFFKLKPVAEGSWECPTCMINNAPDVQKCVACTEPKPGSKSSESISIPKAVDGKAEFKFGSSANSNPDFKFGSTANTKAEFKFGDNASSKSDFKFGDTASSKPEFKFGATANSTSTGFSFGGAASSTVPGGLGFGATTSSTNSFGKPLNSTNEANPFQKLKPAEGSWECPTCMISNKPDILKCVACTEPKPGAALANDTEQPISKPFSFGTSSSSSFTFGTTSKSSSAEGFSFQKIAAGSQDSAISISQPTESAFSFVKPPSESSSVSSGFSFPSSTGSSGSSGFSFVPPVPSIPSVSSTGSTGSSEFSFGKSSNPGSGFSFGNPGNALGGNNPVGFTFGGGAQKETNATEAKAATNVSNGPSSMEHPAPTGFSFGAVNNVEKPSSIPAAGSNIFSSVPSFDSSQFNGMPATTAISTPQFNFASNAKPSFLFNSNDSKPTEPPPAKFNFNPGAMSTPNFNFGGAASAATIFGSPNPSGQFSFANNNNVADGNNETSKANIFAPPAATSNLFSIGGGGSNNTNSTNERRKVKRAHRRLPPRK